MPSITRRSATALLVVAAVALALRGAFLGTRVLHWDEARLARHVSWYAETGAYEYFPMVHGPFLFHTTAPVVDALGRGDAALRLVPALVGGLVPLSAWLVRDWLRRDEVVALAVLLAVNPLFLYYSRFFRSDVPLAACMLVGVGLIARAWATGRRRYLLGAGGAVGLGVTTKENAVLYLLCWVGAAALFAAWRWQATGSRPTLPGRSWVRRWLPASVGAALVWLAVVVLSYAPRAGTRGDVGLDLVGAEPSLVGPVVRAATLGAATKLVSTWVVGGLQSPLRTPAYFLHLVAITLLGATAVSLCAGYGLYSERRDRAAPRPLVAGAALWAGLSLVGYPFAQDLAASWMAIHVVAPLTIPAAVGLAAAVRDVRASHDGGWTVPTDEHTRRVAFALVVLAGYTATVGVTAVYVAPDHTFNPLGQPAQAGDDLRETVAAAETAACERTRPTALFYGSYFAPEHPTYRLPLSWYLDRAGYRFDAARAPPMLPDDRPAVVVALTTERAVLDDRFADYETQTHELDPWVPREPAPRTTETVVYVANRTAASAC